MRHLNAFFTFVSIIWRAYKVFLQERDKDWFKDAMASMEKLESGKPTTVEEKREAARNIRDLIGKL